MSGDKIGELIGIVLALVVMTLGTIASLNVVFGLALGYDFWTVLSVFWLLIVLAAAVRGGTHSALQMHEKDRKSTFF